MRKRLLVLVPLIAIIASVLALPISASTATLPNLEYPTAYLTPTLSYDVAIIEDFGLNEASGNNEYVTEFHTSPLVPITSGVDPEDVAVVSGSPLSVNNPVYLEYDNVNVDYEVIGAPSNSVTAYYVDTDTLVYDTNVSPVRTTIKCNPTQVYRSDGSFINTLGSIFITPETNLHPTAYLTYSLSYVYNGTLQEVTRTMGANALYDQEMNVVYDFGYLLETAIEDADSMVFSPTAPIRINEFTLDIRQPYEEIRFRSVHLNASTPTNNNKIAPSEVIRNFTTTKYERLDLTSFASTIMDSLNGFLSFEIFPGVTLAIVFYTIIGIFALVVILKIFAGG